MNIFEKYLNQITSLILKNKKDLNLDNLDSLNNISVETPPSEFNFDLSCNVCLVLGKTNKTNPIKLAKKIKELIIKNINDFDEIQIAGPGFLNLKLTKDALVLCINKILENRNSYGKKKISQ